MMVDKAFCKSTDYRFGRSIASGKANPYLKCLIAVRTKCWPSMMEVKREGRGQNITVKRMI